MEPPKTSSLTCMASFFGCLVLASVSIANESAVLTSAAEVLAASNLEAKLQPVEIQGVVLSSDADWRAIFLHCPDGNLFVRTKSADVKRGQLIAVEGQLAPGIITPIVINAKIRSVGDGAIPTPTIIAEEDLESFQHHNQLVRVECRVLNVSIGDDHGVLETVVGKTPLNVRVLHMQEEDPYRDFTGRLVVTGVLSAHGDPGLPKGILLHVADQSLIDWPNLTVERIRKQSLRILLWVIIAIPLLVAIGAAWVVSLRRSVAQKSAELQSIHDSIDAGILVESADGKITRSNRRADELLLSDDGQCAGNLLAARLTKLNVDLRLIDEMLQRTNNSDVVLHEEVELADEARTVLRVYSSPIQSKTERLWSFTDVTRERSLERQLIQAEKMKAIGTLAGGVAHDFNNLLTGIIGNLELVRLGDTDGQDELVDSSLGAAHRGAELIRKLLNFSQAPGTPAPRCCDVNAVFAIVSKFVMPSLPRGVSFLVTPSPQPLYAPLDATQLEEVLLNIVNNALAAVGTKGHVEMLVVEEKDAETAKPVITIHVKDDGEGIPDEIRSRVFEPFFTTKSRTNGSGLGLASSYAIVTGIGGKLVFDSCVGQGTQFSVTVPSVRKQSVGKQSVGKQSVGNQSVRSQSTRDPMEVTVSSSSPPMPRLTESKQCDSTVSGTILVVDDEHLVRGLTRRLLENDGYRVIEAEDGQSAIDKLSDEISTVVLDLTMPGLSGRETFAAIRGQRPELPVVIYSGYSVELSNFSSVENGQRVCFLAKPFSSQQLVDAINSVTKDCQSLSSS